MAAALAMQVRGCADFLRSHCRLGGDQSAAVSLANSLAAQVAALPDLSVAEAGSLNEAVGVSGFPLPLQQMLVDAVSSRLLQQPPGGRGAVPRQALHSPWAFLTPGDWQALRDGNRSIPQKVLTVCDRMHRLGLRSATEATVKSLTATLASAHNPEATPAALYALALDVKAALRSHMICILYTHTCV